MNSGKSKNILFFTTLIFLFISTAIWFSGFPAKAYADTQVSQESIDFMTKTSRAMSEVAEAVKPVIVNISTKRSERLSEGPLPPFYDDPLFKRFFGDRNRLPEKQREYKTASLGSGVIVSADGHILTNYHVIKDADEIRVLLSDKREFTGKVIGADPKTELAVIKIEAKDLPSIKWGDSDKLKVGEVVLAVGNPFGLNQTVTMGIVSAVGRANVGIADYEDFIQTDAAINPGNSGGALVNAKAELVGINTAILSRTGGFQGIGLAIPSSMAKTVIESLISMGKVIRGWLGVSVQSITPDLARQFNLKEDNGALVSDVVENSPAEEAGIQRGDVIIEFNGKKVDEPYILRNTVANTHPGDIVNITVVRDGKYKELSVTIGELPVEEQTAPAPAYENTLKGVRVQDLNPELYRQLNLPEKIMGVVVTNIDAGSPAETKLLAGDVILEINRKATSNMDGYKAVVSGIKANDDVLLLVFRKGSSVFITISPSRP